MTHKLTRQPHAFTDLYKKALRKVKEDHPAIIKAEHINGPILLTSGTDDLVWPSASMNEKIVERLKKKRFPYSVKHLYFEDAGHNIRPPYFPTSERKSRKIAYGGKTEADAIAAQTFWRELLLFLEKSTAPNN